MVRRERTSIKVGTERVRCRQGTRERQAGRVALSAGLFPLPPFGSPVLEPDLEAKRKGVIQRGAPARLPPSSPEGREGRASEQVQSDRTRFRRRQKGGARLTKGLGGALAGSWAGR